MTTKPMACDLVPCANPTSTDSPADRTCSIHPACSHLPGELTTMSRIHRYSVLSAVLLSLIAASAVAQETELLAVLRSDASVQEKSAACRQLAQVATKESVPTLAAMLGDEKLSHMARYALETIRDPSADAALRDALDSVAGTPRLGVIGSLGARRDRQAVEALAKLLPGNDSTAAQAAARAGVHRFPRSGSSTARRTVASPRPNPKSAGHLRRSIPLCRDVRGRGPKRVIAGDLRPVARAGGRSATGASGGAARRHSRARQRWRVAAAGSVAGPRLCHGGSRRADFNGIARSGHYRCLAGRTVHGPCRTTGPADQCARGSRRAPGRAGRAPGRAER